jgi:hypothetical protein
MQQSLEIYWDALQFAGRTMGHDGAHTGLPRLYVCQIQGPGARQFMNDVSEAEVPNIGILVSATFQSRAAGSRVAAWHGLRV